MLWPRHGEGQVQIGVGLGMSGWRFGLNCYFLQVREDVFGRFMGLKSTLDLIHFDGANIMAQPAGTVKAGTLDPTFADDGVLRLPRPDISGAEPVAVLPLPEEKLLVAILLSGIDAPVAIVRLNEDGSFDTRFGEHGTGFVEIYMEETTLDVWELLALSDGGWLVIGNYTLPAGGGLYVVRYHEDGKLDASFGEKGLRLLPYDDMGGPTDIGVSVDVSGQDDEKASLRTSRSAGGSAALDGKIFLRHSVTTDSGQIKGIVIRLNSDGSTDYTFNGVGFALIELEGISYDYNYPEAIVVQADGKVLVVGQYALNSLAARGAYVTRFDAMGRLDKGFNGGVVTVSHSSLIGMRDVAVSATDGRIVAVGRAFRNGALHGLMFVVTSDGFFDYSFNRGQPLFSALAPKGLSWRRCVLQSDGSILVAGSTGSGFAEEGLTALTARFRPDGSLDPTFNGNGFVIFDEDEMYENVEDMAVTPDGRIVVCGLGWVDGDPHAYINAGWVIRYLV